MKMKQTCICQFPKSPVVRAIAADVRAGIPAGIVAAKFHNGLATMVRDVCLRLREETGYEAESFRLLAVTHDDGNRGMSVGHHFLATGLRQTTEPDAGDLAEVKPVLMTPAELRRALYDGRVGATGAAASIMFGLCALDHSGG